MNAKGLAVLLLALLLGGSKKGGGSAPASLRGRSQSKLLPVVPIVGKKTSGFGSRFDPVKKKKGLKVPGFHQGIDLSAKAGTPVYAAGAGKVSYSQFNKKGYGYSVRIVHPGGLETRYNHLLELPSVKVGQAVEAGQLVGYCGSTGYSTGAHLHFTVLKDGKAVSPVSIMGDIF